MTDVLKNEIWKYRHTGRVPSADDGSDEMMFLKSMEWKKKKKSMECQRLPETTRS